MSPTLWRVRGLLQLYLQVCHTTGHVSYFVEGEGLLQLYLQVCPTTGHVSYFVEGEGAAPAVFTGLSHYRTCLLLCGG